MTTNLVIFYLVQVVSYTLWVGGILFVISLLAIGVGRFIRVGSGTPPESEQK